MRLEGDKLAPAIWLRAAKEYLDAVKYLIEKASKNDWDNPNDYPILTLLAFAFEHVFKIERQLTIKSFDHGHDLEALWNRSHDTLNSVANSATDDFIKIAIQQTEGEYQEALVQKDPNYGRPKRGFSENLILLNSLTNKPFQSRYPKVAVWEEIETRYLLCVGQAFLDELKRLGKVR